MIVPWFLQLLGFGLTENGSMPSDHFFYDVENGAFWPIRFANGDFDPTAMLSVPNLATEDKSDICFGGKDGYLRQWDRTLFQDDGESFTSKVMIGPLLVGGSSATEGIVEEIQGVLTPDSGNVSWALRVEREYEPAASEVTTAKASGTWTTAGLNPTKRPRRRGTAFSILLSNAETDDGWSIEEVGTVCTERGRRRFGG